MDLRATYSVRFAGIDEHKRLTEFYKSYYQPGHPLYNIDFWKWQFGSSNEAKCLIAEMANGNIIGHICYNKVDDIVWLTNLLIAKDHSNEGLTSSFFDEARNAGQLAAVMVNSAGEKVLAKKKWYRYADLQRFVLISNGVADHLKEEWVKPVKPNVDLLPKPKGRYWQQPGIEGIVLSDGSTAVMQSKAGGLRMIDVVDISAAANEAWELGFNWMDLIVSWNDPLVPHLHNDGWKLNTPLPWYLEPVDFNRQATFNLFSEEPLPKNFLFHRSYADLGRASRID